MILLRRMQEPLARLYDAPVDQDVSNFIVCDRARLSRLVGARAAATAGDEQVFVIEDDQGVRLGLFIDPQVLARLARRDPLRLEGQADQALDRLARTLELAEPGGFMRTFLDEGPPMLQLRHIKSRDTTTPITHYAARLLSAFQKLSATLQVLTNP